MKICGDHWTWLRGSLVKRGLAELISPAAVAPVVVTPYSAADVSKAWKFDPLMVAGAVITNGYLEECGLAGAIGQGCPLCIVDSESPGLAHRWIEGAADSALVEARRLKLAPPVQ